MPQPRQERGLRPLGLPLALGLAGFLVAFRPVADMDYHWHLAQGRALLAGTLPAAADPFTHLPTAGQATLQAWGGDVLFALLDRVGGTTLVRILVALVVGLAWALAAVYGRRRSGTAAGGFLLAAFFAAASLLRIRARPEVFSLLLPWALLLVLSGPFSWRRVALAFGLEALWINLHPGGLMGPLLAVAGLPGPEWRRRALLAGAVLLGSCLHPDGPAMLGLFAGETADLAPLIPEWRPLTAFAPAEFVEEWILVGLALALVLSALRPWRRVPLGDWGVALLGAALAARAVRFLSWLSLPVAAAITAHRDLLTRQPAARLAAFALGAVLLAAWPVRDLLTVHAATQQAGISRFADLYLPHYPVAAADLLERLELQGRLFHPPRWGGYLAARLHPRYRTAHDGRVNLYGAELAARLLRFTDAPERARLVDELGLEILILPPGALPREEWADREAVGDPTRRWLPIASSPVAIVFVDLRGPNARHNLAVLRRRG